MILNLILIAILFTLLLFAIAAIYRSQKDHAKIMEEIHYKHAMMMGKTSYRIHAEFEYFVPMHRTFWNKITRTQSLKLYGFTSGLEPPLKYKVSKTKSSLDTSYVSVSVKNKDFFKYKLQGLIETKSYSDAMQLKNELGIKWKLPKCT